MLVLDYLLFYVYKLNLGFKNLEYFFFRLFATENLDFPSKNYEVVSCASVQMSVWEATEKRWNPSKWDSIRRATSDLRSMSFFFKIPPAYIFFFKSPKARG